jgi:hypothetical protein
VVVDIVVDVTLSVHGPVEIDVVAVEVVVVVVYAERHAEGRGQVLEME